MSHSVTNIVIHCWQVIFLQVKSQVKEKCDSIRIRVQVSDSSEQLVHEKNHNNICACVIVREVVKGVPEAVRRKNISLITK